MEFNRNSYEITQQAAAWFSWLEVAVITTLVIVFCQLAKPDDPFFLNSTIAWPVVAPLLISLRYGFFKGVVSAALLLLIIVLWQRLNNDTNNLTPTYAIFIAITSMVAGEFRDTWERRLSRLQESNQYRQLRLDEFTRSFHMLKVSHDRLEQQMAGHSLSLREALINLRKNIQGSNQQQNLLSKFSPAVANKIMALFSEYGSIQQAAFYQYTEQGIQSEPLSRLGEDITLINDDPLLKHCISTRQVVSINPELVKKINAQHSKYMMCIPFIDSNDRLYAVVVVNSMPFLSFQEPVQKLLAVLAGHIADLFSAIQVVDKLEDVELTDMLVNLKRSLININKHELPSTVISFNIENNDAGYQVLSIIKQIRRGLDLIFEYQTDSTVEVICLLPLTELIGVEGYRNRLQEACQSQLGMSLTQLPVEINIHYMSKDPELLQSFIRKHCSHEHPLVSYSGYFA